MSALNTSINRITDFMFEKKKAVGMRNNPFKHVLSWNHLKSIRSEVSLFAENELGQYAVKDIEFALRTLGKIIL